MSELRGTETKIRKQEDGFSVSFTLLCLHWRHALFRLLGIPYEQQSYSYGDHFSKELPQQNHLVRHGQSRFTSVDHLWINGSSMDLPLVNSDLEIPSYPICSVISLGHTMSKIFLWRVPFVPVAISPLYEAFAENIRKGQCIVHTSNKRPGQTATGQPRILWIVGNLEFWACGASRFLQKICIFLG